MAKKPFKGNYLTLENVRIHYDAKNDSIQLTSKDKDIPEGEAFRLTLNGGKDAELILRKILEDKGMMPKGYLSAIPNIAKKEYPLRDTKWNEIPMGIGRGGKELVWDTKSTPNLLIQGAAGSGKSVIERLIIEHCFIHPDEWLVLGIDLKMVEISCYQNHPSFINHATTLVEAAATLDALQDLLMYRYAAIEFEGVNNLKDLKFPPHSIMLVIDEAWMLLTKSGIKTPQGIREDALKDKMKRTLEQLARLGRSAGIHLAIGSQRVDATIFNGEFKGNLNARISASRASSVTSYMLLDNDQATKLPTTRGRGYFQINGEGEECQFYYTPLEKLDIPTEKATLYGPQALLGIMIDVNQAIYEIESRYTDMKHENVTNYKDLKNSPSEIAVFVDWFTELTELSAYEDTLRGYSKEEITDAKPSSNSYNDLITIKQAQMITRQVSRIARIGRSAGIKVTVNAQVTLGNDDTGLKGHKIPIRDVLNHYIDSDPLKNIPDNDSTEK